MQLKCKKRICTVYREGAVTEWMHQKCFVKFYAADFSLDDTPGSDWPLEVDSDQIETLIENNQHYTMLCILVPFVHVCVCVWSGVAGKHVILNPKYQYPDPGL